MEPTCESIGEAAFDRVVESIGNFACAKDLLDEPEFFERLAELIADHAKHYYGPGRLTDSDIANRFREAVDAGVDAISRSPYYQTAGEAIAFERCNDKGDRRD